MNYPVQKTITSFWLSCISLNTYLLQCQISGTVIRYIVLGVAVDLSGEVPDVVAFSGGGAGD